MLPNLNFARNGRRAADPNLIGQSPFPMNNRGAIRSVTEFPSQREETSWQVMFSRRARGFVAPSALHLTRVMQSNNESRDGDAGVQPADPQL